MAAWDEEKQKLLTQFLKPKAKGMDTGGIAGDDNATDEFLPKTMMTPAGPLSPASGESSSMPETPIVASHQTKTPATPEIPQDEEDNTKTEDSHPGVQPDDLLNYVKGQEAQVDKWGPDKQAALMQHLQQGYRSPGNILAKGGATIADAIMQGVARAGSGGNLSAIDAREKENLDRAAEIGKSLQGQNLEALGKKQALEATSGATPLGASQAPALTAIFSKLGIPPNKIQGLLKNPEAAKSIIEPYTTFMSNQMKNSLEQELKLLEIQVQRENAKVNQGIAQEGRDVEKEKAGLEADKAAAEHWFLSPRNALAAQKRLAEGAGVSHETFSPDVTAYAQKHGITPEQAQAIKNKRSGQ